MDPRTGNPVFKSSLLEGLLNLPVVFPNAVVIGAPIYEKVFRNKIIGGVHACMNHNVGHKIAVAGHIIGKLIGSKISPEPELRVKIVDDPELDKINNLETRGTKAITDYLRGSKLKRIDLSYCNISYNAFQDLVEAANACKTLEYISIKGNSELEGRSFSFRAGLNLEN